jgi:isoleucyl-tRNA synthetase
MKDYRLDEIILEIENLFLELSRVYIKHVREKQSKLVFQTVKEVYIDVLKMFSIVCPFITEKIWQDLRRNKLVKEESVHLASFPKPDKKPINMKLEKDMTSALSVIEAGLAMRDEKKIGLKWPLAKAEISVREKPSKKLEDIIKRQLNVKKLKIKKGKRLGVKLDTKMTRELEGEGYAREISRKIQAERKKAGLVKTDRIRLIIAVDKELLGMLKKQNKFIKERVNASEIEMVEKPRKTFKYSADFRIREKRGKVTFEKA